MPSARVLHLDIPIIKEVMAKRKILPSHTIEFHGLMPRGKTGGGNHAVKGADWEERELPTRYVCGVIYLIERPCTWVSSISVSAVFRDYSLLAGFVIASATGPLQMELLVLFQ
ncbi:hypothetical protein E5288_WYG014162 [Bos mutus]|uniref:Uncharacterized protein n=1 Tax=Bos mutus TaxID=72004 RepID=A0A6B0R4H1_9CETA|nr:hypothetical protein [Bos mutus]